MTRMKSLRRWLGIALLAISGATALLGLGACADGGSNVAGPASEDTEPGERETGALGGHGTSDD